MKNRDKARNSHLLLSKIVVVRVTQKQPPVLYHELLTSQTHSIRTALDEE